jgi:8-oxo-dGTP pyrophosphatase MutT (NUDIX family)
MSRLVAIVGNVSTGHESLPPDQYVASLARKRMVATAFFRDEEGRVLVVNPVYKPVWDLPGGAAEADESPHAACRREVAEELALDRSPDRVLAVDWVPARMIGLDQTLLPDGVIIVYDGRVLTSAEAREIVLADGELAGFEFVTADEATGRVTPLVAPADRRLPGSMQGGHGRDARERQPRRVVIAVADLSACQDVLRADVDSVSFRSSRVSAA